MDTLPPFAGTNEGLVIETNHSHDSRRLDLAARAAWLCYVRGKTQDEIARELGVSRTYIQRLLVLANKEGLIKFRLEHRLKDCIELADRMKDTFGFSYYEVAPSARDDGANLIGIGLVAACFIEIQMSRKVPVTLAVGIGRTLHETVRHVAPMTCPQHRIVALVGNIARDGRASPYDVVIRLADRLGAQCYPLPMPILADSPAERAERQAHRGSQVTQSLVAEASCVLIGVGSIARDAPMHTYGFITDQELGELMELGAVGELLGWPFDREGHPIHTPVTELVTSIPLKPPTTQKVIMIAGGAQKVEAICAAIRTRLTNGIITDEATGRAMLEWHAANRR